MAKLLKLSDYLRLGLALTEEMVVEIRDPFGMMARGCEVMYGWVPPKYRRTSQFNATWKLLTTGSIEKIIKKGEVYYRLTSAGQQKLLRDFPLLKLRNKKWDGGWTLVIFDIPEGERKKRDFLRDDLVELGLGMLQKSVYLTPYDLSEDIRESLFTQGLENEVLVARARKLFAGNPKQLASRVWSLAKINKKYQKIIQACLRAKRGELTVKEKKRIKTQYLEVLVEDPYLPKELLPSDWQGGGVRGLVSRL